MSTQAELLTVQPTSIADDKTRYATGQFNRDTLQLRSGEATLTEKVYEYNGQEHKAPNHPDFRFWTAAVVSSTTALDVDMPILLDNKVIALDDVMLTANLYQQDSNKVLETARLHAVDATDLPRDTPLVLAEGVNDQQTVVLKHTLADGNESSIIVDKITSINDGTTSASGVVVESELADKGEIFANKLTISEGALEIQSSIDDVMESKVLVDTDGVLLSSLQSGSVQQYMRVRDSQSSVGPLAGKFTVEAGTIDMHQLRRNGTDMTVSDVATNEVFLKTDPQDPALVPDFHISTPIVEDIDGMKISVNNLVIYLKRILDKQVDDSIARRLAMMSDDFMNLPDPAVETDFQDHLDSNKYMSLSDLRASVAIINRKITAVVGSSPESLNTIMELADHVNAENGQYSLTSELANMQKMISNIYSMMQELHPSSLTLELMSHVTTFTSLLDQNIVGSYFIHNTDNVVEGGLSTTPRALIYSTYATDSLNSLSGPLHSTRQFNSIVAGKGMQVLYPVRFYYVDGSGVDCTYDLTDSSQQYLKVVEYPDGRVLNPWTASHFNPLGEKHIGFFKDTNLDRYVYIDGFNIVDDFLPESRIFKDAWNDTSNSEVQFKTFEGDLQHHSISDSVQLGAVMPIDLTDVSFDTVQASIYDNLLENKVTVLSSVEISGLNGTWPSDYIPVLAPFEEQSDFLWSQFPWDPLTPEIRKVDFVPTTTFDVSPGYSLDSYTDIFQYMSFQEQNLTIPSVYISDECNFMEIILDVDTIDFKNPQYMAPDHEDYATNTNVNKDHVNQPIKVAKILRITCEVEVSASLTFTSLAAAIKPAQEVSGTTKLNTVIFNILNNGTNSEGQRTFDHTVEVYYRPLTNHLHNLTTDFDEVISLDTVNKKFLYKPDGSNDNKTITLDPLFTHRPGEPLANGDTGMYQMVLNYFEGVFQETYSFSYPILGTKLQVYDAKTGFTELPMVSYVKDPQTNLDTALSIEDTVALWDPIMDNKSAVAYRADWVMQIGNTHEHAYRA